MSVFLDRRVVVLKRLSKSRQKFRDDIIKGGVLLKIGGGDVLGLKCLNKTHCTEFSV